jgi:hypothetical protein
MQKITILISFWIFGLPAMQQPVRQIPNNHVGVTLATIVSRYKNPVRVILANVIYEKDRMADDCAEQYTFTTCGTVKELLKVAAGVTVTCRIPIPMLTVGPDSQVCLLIEDEENSSFDDQFANVWLRKFSDSKNCFFECPKIDNTKKLCHPNDQILITLELYNENRLSRRPFHFYHVNVTSQIKECFDK